MTLRRLLPLALLTIVAGCGGDEGGESGSAATGGGETTTTAAAEDSGPRFAADDVGFTFAYPEGFQQVDEPNDGKVLATVTPTPNDPKNGIKARLTGDSELEFGSYSAGIRKQFEGQLGVKVAVREDTAGGRPVGVMEWQKEVTFTDLGQETTTMLRSASYFFTASGRTWQLECLSTAEEREKVDAACEQAIQSLEDAS
jgi:hypothetical protein